MGTFWFSICGTSEAGTGIKNRNVPFSPFLERPGSIAGPYPLRLDQ
jgi:hypothetical protein